MDKKPTKAEIFRAAQKIARLRNKLLLLRLEQLKKEEVIQTEKGKPDWITEAQWKAVPSVEWWEDQKKGAESIAQQKPVTPEEAQKQFRMLRNEKNWKDK